MVARSVLLNFLYAIVFTKQCTIGFKGPGTK